MWIEKIQKKKENKIAGAHPGAKFAVVILYAVTVLIAANIEVRGYPLVIIPAFLVVAGIAAASKAEKQFIKKFKPVLFFALFILVIQTLVMPGEEELLHIGVLKISEYGLYSGIKYCFTILNIAGIFLWFFVTTDNNEILTVLEERGVNSKVVFLILSSLQMIEIMSNRLRVIMDAQQSRGMEVQGNLLVRAGAFIPSLIPIILTTITDSEERALTLESKGFNIKGTKTHILRVEKSGYERQLVGFFSVLLLLAIGGAIPWTDL